MSSFQTYAGVLLVRNDGALILQQRDNKPGITHPGQVSIFGGGIEGDEQPLEAAVREIGEETNLKLVASDLTFLGKYKRSPEIPDEDGEVFIFVALGIDVGNLEVYEGEGYVLVENLDQLQDMNASNLAKHVATDYYRTKS